MTTSDVIFLWFCVGPAYFPAVNLVMQKTLYFNLLKTDVHNIRTSKPVTIHLVALVFYRVPEEKHAMYLPEIIEEDETKVTPMSSVQNLKAATVGSPATAAAGIWW